MLQRGSSVPASRGHVGERAVAVVSKQLVRPEVGHVEIDPAVVVEVAGRRAHAVAGRDDAAAIGHVGEAKSRSAFRLRDRCDTSGSAGRVRALRTRSKRGALHREQIEVAVVVEVEQRPAGADDLRQQQLTSGAVDVDEVDARLRGDVDERRRRLATSPAPPGQAA